MDQQTVYALLAAGLMLLIGLPIHEFSHALAAYRLGDSTARWQGRLTLDPRAHFDPVGGTMLLLTAALFAFTFGYAKPTPVNPMNLRGGRRGEALVAAAGPLSNLVMASVIGLVIRVIDTVPDLRIAVITSEPLSLIVNVAYYFVYICVVLFVFNLLPVPPLDGWRVLLGLVPPRTAWQLREVEVRYAQMIPFVFLFFILLGGGRIIVPISDAITGLLTGT